MERLRLEGVCIEMVTILRCLPQQAREALTLIKRACKQYVNTLRIDVYLRDSLSVLCQTQR